MRRRSIKDNNTTDCYVKLAKVNLDNLNITEIKSKSVKMSKTRRSKEVAVPVVIEEIISNVRAKRTPKPNRKYLDSADKTIVSRENTPVDRRGIVKKKAQSDDEFDVAKVAVTKKLVSKISVPKTEPIRKSVPRVVLSKEKELMRTSTPIRSLRNNDLLTSKRKIDMEIDEKKPPAKKMKDNSIDEQLVQPVKRLTRQTKIETKSPEVVIKSTTITKKLNVSKNEVKTKIPKEIISKKIDEPIKPIENIIEPEDEHKNISTEIDFEDEVPSFKIVNVNDIIMKKKGDEIPTIDDKTDTKKNQSRLKAKPISTYIELSDVEDYDDDDSYDGDFDHQPTTTDDSDDDDDVPLRKIVKRNNSNSRRKAQHTKILSDDVKTASQTDANKKIPDFASKRANLKNRLNESLGNIKLKAAVTTPKPSTTSTPKVNTPQKILNSTLGNKFANKFTPIISKVVAKASPAKQQNILTPKKLINNNIRTYKNSHSKLPMKNNVVSKNITCVEKWFVMNYSNEDISKVITTKYYNLLTLTQLGNEMKNLKLPTDDWSYKISLEKKLNKENQSKTTEIYTGEVQDITIDESDKQNYHPTHILFKRKNNDKESKLQFDRTVAFKGSTYSITMDGINVKLIGAPIYLHNIQEIQTLLQIMDDVSLINSYVEKN